MCTFSFSIGCLTTISYSTSYHSFLCHCNWLQCVVILCHVENVLYYTLLNCEVTMIDKMLPNCKCMYACLVLSFSLVAIMTTIYITS